MFYFFKFNNYDNLFSKKYTTVVYKIEIIELQKPKYKNAFVAIFFLIFLSILQGKKYFCLIFKLCSKKKYLDNIINNCPHKRSKKK